MARYVLVRLLSAIPVLFLVTFISFSVMRFVPGDPAIVLAGPEASPQDVARLRDQLALDQPFILQITAWYGQLLRGNLGDSILLGRSVVQAIIERAPVTLSLAGFALIITVVLGVPAGIWAAVRHNSWVDQAVMVTAMLGVALPNFWLGLMLIFVFSVSLGWFPSGGYVSPLEDPLGWLTRMILPAVSLGFMQMGLLARITRSSMLDLLSQDFVRTARAKGVHPRNVIARHTLRNAMLPIVTVIGTSVGLLLGGSVIIETVYSIPGFGRLLVSAIQRRDYPMVQGGLLITATLFVVINLIVDLLYAVLDPRIRYG